jgi:REP element-mobilizing transposase RayT
MGEERDRQRYPARPKRLDWVYGETPLYFVTSCTHGRAPLLARAVAHEAFLVAAGKVSEAGNAVGRYVLMPDHMHVFLRIGRGGRLGLAVKCLKEGITKRLREEFPDLTVWQPGFIDHVLRSAESYAAKWAYVRENPVRAGLLARADEWPYQGEVVALAW